MIRSNRPASWVTVNYRQPSRREIWAGIKEKDAFRTCCLCGEVIGKDDYQPGYPGGYVAHSGCWQENERLGHKLSLMPSKLMVEANYRNQGTFYALPSERRAQNQDLK